ncbi:MAG: hypothetical protein Q8Q14_00710 [Gemmatimonadales bacterium]|nr:hypothetical protein [Gemmatimonadales bacterium]
MDANNAPVRRPRPEFHTADIGIEQKPAIESREDLVDEVITAPEDVLKAEYAAALKFNEEPVTIRIERSSEKFAPLVVDCWCNGKGAEVLINGRWVETAYLPIGVPVTTKRKYVEILARSKIDSVQTKVEDRDSEKPRNLVERFTSSRAPFSVLEDRNPKGAAWLTGIVRFN